MYMYIYQRIYRSIEREREREREYVCSQLENIRPKTNNGPCRHAGTSTS